MSKTRRYSDSVAWPMGPFHSTPALLNATSRRPYLSTVKSTIALTSASLATSARTNAASPPSFLISATTCAPSFSRLPVRTTFAPARANSIAVVLPIPDVPPVTSATLPENLLLFIVFLSVCDFAKSLKNQKFSSCYFFGNCYSFSLDWRHTSVPPIGVIALIRRRTGIRSQTKERVVRQAAIRKPCIWDSRHSVQSIRDVPCARLRVSVAEVERKAGLPRERLQKR